MALWNGNDRVMVGLGGRAELVDLARVEHQRPDTEATVALWLLTCPGWSPVWTQYVLAVIHLRPIEGVPPAHMDRSDASHEVMLVALDPTLGTVSADSYLTVSPPFLTPINVRHQVTGITDEDARRLAGIVAAAVVHGLLVPEPEGILGARERWALTLDSTVEHYRTDGTHAPNR